MIAVLAFALAMVPLPAQAQTAPIGPYGTLPWVAANTAIDTATLVPSKMYGILIGTPTAAASYTTPTATLLCGLFPFVGQSGSNFNWDLVIKNTSAGAFACARFKPSACLLAL